MYWIPTLFRNLESHTRKAVITSIAIFFVLPIILITVWVGVSADKPELTKGIGAILVAIATLAVSAFWLFMDGKIRKVRQVVIISTFAFNFILFPIPIWIYLLYTRGVSRGIVAILCFLLLVVAEVIALALSVFALNTVTKFLSSFGVGVTVIRDLHRS